MSERTKYCKIRPVDQSESIVIPFHELEDHLDDAVDGETWNVEITFMTFEEYADLPEFGGW